MNYIEYSNQVTSVIAMLSNAGFQTNQWTRECYGNVSGEQCFITFYPDDEKFILFMREGKEGKYISEAELISILNHFTS